jgi:hypothetical protein
MASSCFPFGNLEYNSFLQCLISALSSLVPDNELCVLLDWMLVKCLDLRMEGRLILLLNRQLHSTTVGFVIFILYSIDNIGLIGSVLY